MGPISPPESENIQVLDAIPEFDIPYDCLVAYYLSR
jgi:hypothetical protein